MANQLGVLATAVTSPPQNASADDIEVEEVVEGDVDISLNFASKHGTLVAAYCEALNTASGAKGVDLCERTVMLPSMRDILLKANYHGLGSALVKWGSDGWPKFMGVAGTLSFHGNVPRNFELLCALMGCPGSHTSEEAQAVQSLPVLQYDTLSPL